MTDFASLTHKWRAAPAGSLQNEGSRVVKRNRQPVSCAPCRNRKLKCDRGHPCDACCKRNDEDACTYGKVATASPARREELKTTVRAQDRLRHLEDLVRQMISPANDMPTYRIPPTDDHQQPEGSLSKDVNGVSYTGSTHWATVLDQIQELRNTILPNSNTEDDGCLQLGGGRSDSLFAAPQPPSLQALLQKYLPPREACNRYLSTFFNAKYIFISFIHTYQFKRQYERFWDNQLEVSPIWLSILFSVMCLADGVQHAPLSLYRNETGRPRSQPPFLVASAQCLVLGNFVKPQPFIIEALAMHCQCKYIVTLDPSHELGMVGSVLARQAYAMGYHREPSMFKGHFTPFESEMRRRCWSCMRQFDVMVSFQVGLPGMIQPDSSDTQAPGHFLDEDFDEDTAVLPIPRPDTEATQMLYIITKGKLMETYSKICQHTLTFPKQPFTAADIASLDAAISQTIDSVPAVLRVKPMLTSYADPTNLIMVRSNLMLLGEKARCTLHRKYMMSGPHAVNSRRICKDSSRRMITRFLDINAELQPGGQLFNDRWMMTSFTINDFLLALMISCLAFSLDRKNFIANGGDTEKWLEHDDEALRLYSLLAKAQPVCAEYGSKAREARQVAEALGYVLAKMKPKRGRPDEATPVVFPPQMPNLANGGLPIDRPATGTETEKMPLDIMPLSIHHNPATINALSTTPQFPSSQVNFILESSVDPTVCTTAQFTFLNPTEPSPTSSWELMDNPLPNILEGPEQIDWVQFDQFLWTYGIQNGMDDEIL